MPYLASIYGGPVAVRKDARGRLQAEQSVYRVELDVADRPEPLGQTVTGQVQISGTPRSMASRMWDRVVAVAIRESNL